MWTKWTIKYVDDYRKIRAAQNSDLGPSPFDMELLGKERWYSPILRRGFALLMRALFWFFRTFRPVPRLGRLVAVARAADVEDVLARPQTFKMPYGLEMRELAGADFMLGIDGPRHAAQRKMVVDAIKPREDAKLMAGLSRERALRMIEASGGRIDVMKDLITRVASDVCIEYLGLETEDPDEFAEWTMAMSALLFADWFGDETTRKLALAAAERIRAVVDRSIRLTQDGRGVPDSLLHRLLLARKQGSLTGEVGDEALRAVMIGMSTGLVPTNTLGAGKMLEELLRRPDAMAAARQAAQDAEQHDSSGTAGENPHKERLRKILLEAGRLNPALSPGQWRYVDEDTVIGSGWYKKRVEKGCALMVGTMSALRDSRAIRDPASFRYDREETDKNFMFGDGVHVCIGKRVAMMQITEIFQVLLSQPNLRVASDRYGKMRWTSAFPVRLDMEFDAPEPEAVQQMLTICAPLREGASAAHVAKLVADLQTHRAFRRALFNSRIVHFASLNVIEAGDALEPRPYLMLELNIDGERKEAIKAFAASAGPYLAPIFEYTPLGASDLAATCTHYALDLGTRLTQTTGLNFNGTPEFSVAEIEEQRRLAVFTRKALDFFMKYRSGIGSRAMPPLNFVRALMRGDEAAALREVTDELDLADSSAMMREFRKLVPKGKKLELFKKQLYLPGRKRLEISDWIERTNEDALYHFLKSADFWKPASPFVAFGVLMSAGIYAWIGFHGETDWFSRVIVSLTGGLVTMIMLVLSLLTAFLLVLRWHERTDIPDDREAAVSRIAEVTARENLPHHAQNHFTAVTLLKPGWFRKLTLVTSLWGIKQLIRHSYRPGFVLNMGTIHYAKWFHLPGTNKLIFLSNFDGSWESYLEDFVMKAHAGQSAAWSNGIGFPETKLLIYKGAEDGDRFKRWVRRQQVPTLFWYSRFPNLTTDQIRNNAVTRQGIARAHSDSTARSWLACFGSMQRPDHAIESSEVQSLVFRGFKRSPHAIYALVRLPDEQKPREEWLRSLLPKVFKQNRIPTLDGIRQEGTNVTFGDYPFRVYEQINDVATFVAFSSAGLRKLGLSEEAIATFPAAFNIGMFNRHRSLGDRHDPSDPKWRWRDAIEAGRPEKDDGLNVADAILIVYAKSADRCKAALKEHEGRLGRESLFIQVPAKPAMHEKDDDFVFREHFGFRDGISQPVIRGTQRLNDAVNERDIVEPGEFILGYRNNQGYYPPAVRVGMNTDFVDRLPDVLGQSPPTFPPFRTSHPHARDFGRNGTFLVLRQIQQHVPEFEAYIAEQAARLEGTTRAIVGSKITREWIAAKMMGRWKSGAPLVLRPVAPTMEGREQLAAANVDSSPEADALLEAQAQPDPDERVEHGPKWDLSNDFGFANDDPQGFRCPFGAHIRRANPRDGLRAGDAAQQSITNRHRLLRRGRPYESGANEKGLMFACICADLERQFEFVQQTWIGSSSFHGLTDEVDPVIGSQHPKRKGRFTIPTPSGPVTLTDLESFVTVRAGGYFFMPSFSALQYLWDLARDTAAREESRKDGVAESAQSPVAGVVVAET